MLRRNFGAAPAVVLVLSFCLVGCAGGPVETSALSEPDKKPAKAVSEYARTYMDFKHGAIADAESRLRPLLAATETVKDEPYIRGRAYNRRAEYASGLALAAIERGEIENGRRQFAAALRTLAQDEQQLVSLTRQDDDNRQIHGNVVSLGLIGVAASLDYKNIQAQTYQTNTSMLTTLNNSGVVNTLSQRHDTTDQLKLFLGEQPRDTDGVRMIVMPALNGPMSVIGRVAWRKDPNSGSFMSCTGTLVGPRAILTAAHCFSEGYRKADPSEVTFTISSPSYTNTARAVRIITPTEIWRERDWDNDWAVVVLERNPSSSQDFLAADDGFNPASPKSQWSKSLKSKLYLAGYSSDLNDGRFLTLAANCSFDGATGPLIGHHRCPSWKGSSGGAVMVKHGKAGNDAYSVIGIQSFGPLEKYNMDTLKGMRLVTADVADAIRRANGE